MSLSLKTFTERLLQSVYLECFGLKTWHLLVLLIALAKRCLGQSIWSTSYVKESANELSTKATSHHPTKNDVTPFIFIIHILLNSYSDFVF